MKRKIFLFVSILGLILVTNSGAQEKPTSADYTWLNGKWEGTPPMGGSYLMELQLTNGNQIRGEGKVQNVRGAATGTVTGTVNGTNVDLEVFTQNQRGSSTVKYALSYGDGVLAGKGTNVSNGTSAETTFKKVN